MNHIFPYVYKNYQTSYHHVAISSHNDFLMNLRPGNAKSFALYLSHRHMFSRICIVSRARLPTLSQKIR